MGGNSYHITIRSANAEGIVKIYFNTNQ